MFLQNLRAKVGARLNGDSEAGFTLIELLVVMLILGILAAIAIPAFFSQREKANDAQAKSMVRSAQTAIETYATDNQGIYTGADPADLVAIEPTLADAPGALTVDVSGTATDLDGTGSGTAVATSYVITVASENSPNTFTVARSTGGRTGLVCANAGNDGCPTNGTWG